MTAHSSILAWEIQWPEEPGGLQFIGSQRVGQYRVCARSHTQIHIHTQVAESDSAECAHTHTHTGRRASTKQARAHTHTHTRGPQGLSRVCSDLQGPTDHVELRLCPAPTAGPRAPHPRLRVPTCAATRTPTTPTLSGQLRKEGMNQAQGHALGRAGLPDSLRPSVSNPLGLASGRGPRKDGAGGPWPGTCGGPGV